MSLQKPIRQINQSITRQKGAVRGLHYQKSPALEAKIVRCLRGRVFDVMVDLRADSPTFLKHQAVELSAENAQAVYIPEGFAHGFQALEEDCELLYLHMTPYSKEYEGGLRYDDPKLGIQWPLAATQLSQRDTGFPLLDPSFRGIVS